METDSHKEYRPRKAGVKAERKKLRNELKKRGGVEQDKSARERNPKAFSTNSARSAQMAMRRKMDLQGKKYHLPKIDHDALAASPPPIIVAVVGPPKVFFHSFFISFSFFLFHFHFHFFYRLGKQH